MAWMVQPSFNVGKFRVLSHTNSTNRMQVLELSFELDGVCIRATILGKRPGLITGQSVNLAMCNDGTSTQSSLVYSPEDVHAIDMLHGREGVFDD